jgi:hypothetical protein
MAFDKFYLKIYFLFIANHLLNIQSKINNWKIIGNYKQMSDNSLLNKKRNIIYCKILYYFSVTN